MTNGVVKKSNFYFKTWRMNNLYVILDKDKNEVIFRRNKAQQFLAYIKSLDLQNRGCVRVIILKARQHGITTGECIEKLDEAMFYENRNIKLSAHNEKKATEIFETIKFAYDKCPSQVILSDGTIWEKPKTKYLTKSSIHFADGNSKIEVVLDTRSGTPSDVHITELAFVEKAKEMMTGTLPSIPKKGNVTIESTANGASGQFHEMRTKNYNNPKGTFTCIFFPWYIAPEYRSKLDDGETIELPQELKHLRNYNLDDEQLKRYMEQFFDLGDKVFQEYPSNPEEAFLASGRLYFNTGIIKRLLKLDYEVDQKYWEKDNQLRRYKKPDKENQIEDMLMGVDTSEGLPDGDYCSIKFRNRKFELICSYKGRCKPDELCDVIEYILEETGAIGVIGIEKNNTGLVTLKEAKSRWWYYMLYKTTIEDQATRKKTKKVGFTTTGQTRPLILGEMEKAIRQGTLKEIDEREKGEMYGFVYNSEGKPEAQVGGHDDDIMSDAICIYMQNEPQQITISEGEEETDG